MNLADFQNLQEEFETYLGNPYDSENPFSVSQLLELDEGELYPHVQISRLISWGLHHYFIPEEFGGKAVNVYEGFCLFRQLARRDTTLCTVMTLAGIGYMAIWAGGSQEQRRRFSERMLRGLRISWGLSEPNHGSDILANEMSAVRVENGYQVTGQKWMIGNASLAECIALFIRTSPKGGPGGFSLLILEKEHAGTGTIELTPKLRSFGLRGMDLSGCRLNAAFVPAQNVVGGEGRGLETALKSSQIIRTIISCIPLGTVDASLQLVLRFAQEHMIFGQRVIDIPYSRRQFADCFVELMTAEALALSGVRSLQEAPEQASVNSSVVKFFVPTLLEGTMDRLAVLLGGRYFLRLDPRFGLFQKHFRDIRVAGFADGNTIVNRKNVAAQLNLLLATAARPDPVQVEKAIAVVSRIYRLGSDLPPYMPWRQEITNRGIDYDVLAFHDSLERLARCDPDPLLPDALRFAQLIESELVALHEACETLRREAGTAYGQSHQLLAYVDRYGWIKAAVSAVHLFVHGRENLDPCWNDVSWVTYALQLITQRLGLHREEISTEAVNRVHRLIAFLDEDGRMFSFLKCRQHYRQPKPLYDLLQSA